MKPTRELAKPELIRPQFMERESLNVIPLPEKPDCCGCCKEGKPCPNKDEKASTGGATK